MNQSPQSSVTTGRSRAVEEEEMFTRTCKLANCTYLKIPVRYLDAPSEKDISESSQIK